MFKCWCHCWCPSRCGRNGKGYIANIRKRLTGIVILSIWRILKKIPSKWLTLNNCPIFHFTCQSFSFVCAFHLLFFLWPVGCFSVFFFFSICYFISWLWIEISHLVHLLLAFKTQNHCVEARNMWKINNAGCSFRQLNVFWPWNRIRNGLKWSTFPLFPISASMFRSLKFDCFMQHTLFLCTFCLWPTIMVDEAQHKYEVPIYKAVYSELMK